MQGFGHRLGEVRMRLYDLGQLVLSFLICRTEKDETCLSGLEEGGESLLEVCDGEPPLKTGTIPDQRHLLPEAHSDHPPAGRDLGIPQRFTAPPAQITLGALGGVRARPGVSRFSPQSLKAWSGAEGTDRVFWGGQICRQQPTAPYPAFFSLV